MYAAEFAYHRPNNIDEAIELLEQDSAEILAGGHSLIPLMKQRFAEPDAIVDITQIEELAGVGSDGQRVNIGALTLHRDIAESKTVQNEAAAVAEAAANITGGVQVSNRGTIGGNIAHADPGSDFPAALLASDATIVAQSSSGERKISADDFFLGVYTTALEEREIITQIEIPSRQDGIGVYVKKKNPASGFAIVGVAIVLETGSDNETIELARAAANGVLTHAVRLNAVEDALVGTPLDSDRIETAAQRADEGLDSADVMEDVQASSDYRLQLLKAYTERALSQAAEQIG